MTRKRTVITDAIRDEVVRRRLAGTLLIKVTLSLGGVAWAAAALVAVEAFGDYRSAFICMSLSSISWATRCLVGP